MLTFIINVAIAGVVLPASTLANPLSKRQSTTAPSSSSSNSQSNDVMGPAKYWIPAVAAVAIVLILGFSCWGKRRLERATTAMTSNPSAAQTAANTNANSSTTRPARTRRPRRTPSQISTRSLPEYMKEPGEQELVIFRGREDMEDGTIVQTDPAHPRVHSIRLSTYGAFPESPQHEGLLQSRSSDTRTPSTGGHSPADSQGTDERGEAPPYPGSEDAEMDPRTPLTSESTSPPAIPTRSDHTISSLRNLFNRFSSVTPRNSVLPVTRSETSTNPHSESFRPGHQPQTSTGSVLSGMWRGDSRVRNLPAGHMSSPSMISLNSISAPLSHTLMRSDVTYPTGGPTPDQMKALSSLDSFSKFGKPYGDAAVAYAASSRHDLENPPPGFEPQEGETRTSIDTGSVESNEGTVTEEVLTRPPGLQNQEEPLSPVSTEHGLRRSEDIDATASTRASFVSAVSHLSGHTES